MARDRGNGAAGGALGMMAAGWGDKAAHLMALMERQNALLEQIDRELTSHPEAFVVGTSEQAAGATVTLQLVLPPAIKYVLRRTMITTPTGNNAALLLMYENNPDPSNLVEKISLGSGFVAVPHVNSIVLRGGARLVLAFSGLTVPGSVTVRTEGDLFPIRPSEV